MKKYFYVLVLAFVLALTSQCKKEEEESPDTTAPVITLKGANPMMVNKDSTFEDPGYTATDDKDGDITSKVKTEGTVDTSVEGTYYIKYNVSDAAGNKAEEKVRKVKVLIF